MQERLSSEDVARLGRAAFTYSEVGATRTQLPSGYRHLLRTATIGAGRSHFDQASSDLFRWEMHRRAGVRLRPSTAIAAAGSVAVLALGFGIFAIKAPVRVVYVLDKVDQRGFAYGTLPGHPETGEEAFITTLQPDKNVTFTVCAFSRPGSLQARLAGRLARLVQDITTERYLRALTQQSR